MHVATVLLRLRLDDCSTPRQRRRAFDAITEKLRRHFNVSLAEVSPGRSPDEGILAAAAVGRSRREAREVLERVADAVAAHPHAALVEPAVIADL